MFYVSDSLIIENKIDNIIHIFSNQSYFTYYFRNFYNYIHYNLAMNFIFYKNSKNAKIIYNIII